MEISQFMWLIYIMLKGLPLVLANLDQILLVYYNQLKLDNQEIKVPQVNQHKIHLIILKWLVASRIKHNKLKHKRKHKL